MTKVQKRVYRKSIFTETSMLLTITADSMNSSKFVHMNGSPNERTYLELLSDQEAQLLPQTTNQKLHYEGYVCMILRSLITHDCGIMLQNLYFRKYKI